MIPSLPTELLRSILEQVEGEQDRANCCSTSKSFLHIARPLLYSTLELNLCLPDDDFQMGEFSSLGQLFDRSTIVLLGTVVSGSHLQPLVLRIVFKSVCEEAHPDAGLDQFEQIGWMFVWNELSALKEVIVVDIDRIFEVDNFLSCNRIRWRNPSRYLILRLAVRLSPKDGTLFEFKASYTSLEFAPEAAFAIDRAAALLDSAKSTLQSLTIPFDETDSLPDFPQLESLELIFALPPIFEEEIVLPGTADQLYASLPRIVTLKTLILSDPLDMNYLGDFPTEPLALSLPPNLRSLSLEGRFVPDNLPSFIKSIPEASRLVRLNVKTGEEELSSKCELEVECEKRGIKLTFDEVWENKI